MTLLERHLFGPGPSNPYPEATNALARPLLGHLDPAFLDLFFGPRPPPTLKDALTTVFAGGAFLEQPLWLRARLACVRLGVRVARARRRRLGLPLESQLTW